MVWVSIDHPTKTFTIHSELNCVYIKNKKESLYHGLERLKRDGGWLKFTNVREAEEYYLAKYDTYMLMEHCIGNEQNIVKIGKK